MKVIDVLDRVGTRSVRKHLPSQPRRIKVATHVPAYFRLQEAGFVFDSPVFHESLGKVEGCFFCVCGREEWYRLWNPLVVNDTVDVASYVELGGAVSARHLKGDGYSASEINNLRKAYV
jgi:hypothetical protein